MSGSAISRRLMAAMFAVTIVPILGWSVVVDLAEHLADDVAETGALEARALEEGLDRAKSRLVIVLGLSLATLAAASLYLRRVLVSPLESLAERARNAPVDWKTPPESARNDEIGDLARALDHTVRELADRVERARTFAADVSHELRTPLAAIQGAAELLANEDLGPAEVRRFNANILGESRRLGRLIEGILELERGTGHPRRTEEGCELVASVRHVTEGLTPLAQRLELEFEVSAPQEPAWAAIDADRHNRVLFALLENALKFSPARAVIAITVEREASALRVMVEDRGPGVAPNERDFIFERRAQTPHGRQAHGGGGLGLAIAKALVESWGGRIAVDEREGGGARFHYDVPARLALSDGAASPALEDGTPPART